MKIKLKFTEDHLKLIRAINFDTIDVEEILKTFNQFNRVLSVGEGDMQTTYSLAELFSRYDFNIDSVYGVDTYNLWGGAYMWEKVAYILGVEDQIIEGTKENAEGASFNKETMEYMHDVVSFITANIKHIFNILLQFCTEGIQPNRTYWCYDYENIWYVDESKS